MIAYDGCMLGLRFAYGRSCYSTRQVLNNFPPLNLLFLGPNSFPPLNPLFLGPNSFPPLKW